MFPSLRPVQMVLGVFLCKKKKVVYESDGFTHIFIRQTLCPSSTIFSLRNKKKVL